MKCKTLIYDLSLLVLGLVLVALSCLEALDEFWSGMGSALMAMGIVRLLRGHRLRKNEAYREKMEVQTTDERLKYIRNKAWAWAGYLFILFSGIAVIVLEIAGQHLLSMVASCVVCLMLVLYWICFWILAKKY